MFSTRSQSVNHSALYGERVQEEPLPTPGKNAQSTVTLVYQSNIGAYYRRVTVLWSKYLMNYSLSLTVASADGEAQYTCKIDLKPWHFWSRRGYKSFEVEGTQVHVYWDLRSVKFVGSSPEPVSDYYVAVVADEEVVLLLGDYKKKAYKRTKARPGLEEPILFYKKENVFAKKSFGTRARFDNRSKEHDIVVEGSTSGPKEPELLISIDGIVLIQVKNLQWKFRGNQTVLVDKQPVQVLWDVHDWLFQNPGSSQGLFIFKPMVAAWTESESDIDGGDSDTGSTGTRYYPATSDGTSAEFCLFLYASKIE